MSQTISKLRKKLLQRRRLLKRQIEAAREKGSIFADESGLLRLSHIELITEILTWIKEHEKSKHVEKK
jgi:hypothetical protein